MMPSRWLFQSPESGVSRPKTCGDRRSRSRGLTASLISPWSCGSPDTRQAIVRLFLAINLDPAVRRAVIEAVAPLRTIAPDLAWVREPNLHLTVKFLGEQPDDFAAS